jgi:hypothetical protein
MRKIIKMEIVLINKKEIPTKPEITKDLRALANKCNAKTGIRVHVNLKDKSAGIESAWRKICKKEYNKIPHIKVERSPSLKTLWLWME